MCVCARVHAYEQSVNSEVQHSISAREQETHQPGTENTTGNTHTHTKFPRNFRVCFEGLMMQYTQYVYNIDVEPK